MACQLAKGPSRHPFMQACLLLACKPSHNWRQHRCVRQGASKMRQCHSVAVAACTEGVHTFSGSASRQRFVFKSATSAKLHDLLLNRRRMSTSAVMLGQGSFEATLLLRLLLLLDAMLLLETGLCHKKRTFSCWLRLQRPSVEKKKGSGPRVGQDRCLQELPGRQHSKTAPPDCRFCDSKASQEINYDISCVVGGWC